ncbi:MAG: hypothetical protein ACOYXC_06315 [Candidatus Rifleibacteriota bacterium]
MTGRFPLECVADFTGIGNHVRDLSNEGNSFSELDIQETPRSNGANGQSKDAKEKECPDKSSDTDMPIVLPMLVTDQIESSLRSSRAEELQQYALAVAAGYAGLGGAIDLEDISHKIRSALRPDLNHRFSVSRVNNNTVRVHFGARQVPQVGPDKKNEYRYVADEGNHRVTLVILLPDDWVKCSTREIHFIAKAHVTDSMTGKRHDSPDNLTIDSALDALGKEGGHPLFDTNRMKELKIDSNKEMSDDDRQTFLSALESDVRNNNYREFHNKIDSKFCSAPESRQQYHEIKNSLWHEMSGLSIGSRYISGSFWASKYAKPSPSFGEGVTKILALDDGKKTNMIIPGVKHLTPDQVQAQWLITMKTDGNTKNQEFALDNYSAKLEGRTQLNVVFPSLKQLGLPKPENGSKVSLTSEGPEETIKRDNINVIYVPTGEGKADGIAIKTNIDKLNSGDNIILEIAIIPTKDSPLTVVGPEDKRKPNDNNINDFYQIAIHGARVDQLPAFLSKPTAKKPFSYPIVGSGTGEIKLDGLVPDSKVSLIITSPAGYAEEEKIEIIVTGKKVNK